MKRNVMKEIKIKLKWEWKCNRTTIKWRNKKRSKNNSWQTNKKNKNIWTWRTKTGWRRLRSIRFCQLFFCGQPESLWHSNLTCTTPLIVRLIWYGLLPLSWFQTSYPFSSPSCLWFLCILWSFLSFMLSKFHISKLRRITTLSINEFSNGNSRCRC